MSALAKMLDSQEKRGGGGGGGGGSRTFGGRWTKRRDLTQSQPRNTVRNTFMARQRREQPPQRRTNSRWCPQAPEQPDSFGTVCQCSLSKQKSIYRQTKNSDHTIHRSNLPNKHQATLLCNHGQFCGGFFHTSVSTEANNPFLCVGEGCIKASTCVLVVRLERKGEEPFIARYTNCYRGYVDSVHAEQFMIADPILQELLEKDNEPKQLTMFITQQPCHHSSGRVENKEVSANTSCTNRVLEWSHTILQARNVHVVIKLSRIFRAHWEDEDVHETAEDAQVFGSRAKMAKEGLLLLMNEPNIEVEMLNLDDWHFLLSMSDNYVYNGGKRIGTEMLQEPKVTDDMIQQRIDGDVWFCNFLEGLKNSKTNGGDGGGGGGGGGSGQ